MTQGFTADFTGVEVPSNNSIAAGNYIANIFKATWGEVTGELSKNKGAPKVSVEFRLPSLNDRPQFQTYMFTDQGMPYTKQLLIASGKVKEEELQGKVAAKALIEMFERVLGQEVCIRVTSKYDPNSRYDDKKSNNVQAVYSKRSEQAERARSASSKNSDPLAP